jgi:hypothetical protein
MKSLVNALNKSFVRKNYCANNVNAMRKESTHIIDTADSFRMLEGAKGA